MGYWDVVAIQPALQFKGGLPLLAADADPLVLAAFPLRQIMHLGWKDHCCPWPGKCLLPPCSSSSSEALMAIAKNEFYGAPLPA